MSYYQITPDERYTLAALRTQQPRLTNAEIARRMERHPSTISRELRRNSARGDGAYRAGQAQEHTNARRSRTRHWSKLTGKQWMLAEDLLREGLSPDQISGKLRRDGKLYVSHEAIYQHVWADKHAGGSLYLFLRQRTRRRRKRYATKERRGRVAGKRHISERPAAANERREFGHWEIDTIHGSGRDSVVTLVDRLTGLALIGKLANLSTASLNTRVVQMIRRFERKHGHSFKTVTADNGTEFHSYETIERKARLEFYFATPYHSWERGTNENTNGLIRQYLPKRTSFASLTQAQCNAIAGRLNERPRKRHGYATPLERLAELRASPRP
ncbi:MAG TPA: IS30 family transposase [Pyrinomonadaceae bacterium]|nr:IS30 family transposase [Pyrinomonadaceae bacterium]